VYNYVCLRVRVTVCVDEGVYVRMSVCTTACVQCVYLSGFPLVGTMYWLSVFMMYVASARARSF
jgi:hypothetical protein